MKNGSSCDTYLGYALFVDAFFLKMIMILLTFLSLEVLLGRKAGAMGQGGHGRPEHKCALIIVSVIMITITSVGRGL